MIMSKLRENVIRLLCLTYILTCETAFAQQSNYSNLVKPNEEQFTEAQINSLRERFIQAGYRNRLCQLVGNDYMYWNIPMSKDISANQLSERLKIPTDTLYILTKSAVKSLFGENIGDIKKYDNIYSTLFNNPSFTINELEEKKMFISNFYVYNLYIAYDPNIILKTKKEIEADKEKQFYEALNFSDNLKTYSGKFNLGALHGSYANPTSWRNGTAIYQYKDASDGSRIFEGKFSFNQDDKYKAYGFFKDNRQIGKWTWEHGNNIITIINFDNVGKSIEGEFVVHNPSKTSVFVKGEFKNGYITHLTYVQDNVEVNGRFDKDKPVGRWYFKNEKHFYSVFSDYSNDGNLIENWHYIEYDNSTGDKRKVRLYNMERYSPETLKDFTMGLIGRYIMRSTLK